MIYLSICNNCDTILIDENPGSDSFLFPDSILQQYPTKRMVLLEEGEERYCGCPCCETDGYLADVESEDQIKEYRIEE